MNHITLQMLLDQIEQKLVRQGIYRDDLVEMVLADIIANIIVESKIAFLA